jgi:uncharacterized membrane protein
MSKFSGFVPIDFRRAGYFLLITGVICLLLAGIAGLTGWFILPQGVLVFGLVAIVISVYIIFVTPKEP